MHDEIRWNQRVSCEGWVPWRVLLRFLLLVWTGAVSLSAQPLPGPQQEWFEVFGFWTRDEGLETTLLINNPTAEARELEVAVFDHRNHLLALRMTVIDPSGSLSLPVSDWVSKKTYGYARVSFPGAVCLLPVQGVISGESSWAYDFRDGRAVRSGTGRIQGLAPALGKHSNRDDEEYVLTNLGTEKRNGELIFEDGGKPARIKWSLKGGETRIYRAPHKVVDRRRPMLVSVVPEEADAAILALAYRKLEQGGFLPIRLEAKMPTSSGELGGFFAAPTSLLLLWNPAMEAEPAELVFYDGEGGNFRRQVVLEPESITELELGDLLDDPAQAAGALLVRSSPGQRLLGMILDREPQLSSSVLKDTALDTRTAYSLAVRLADDLSTRLRIFNPLDERVTICLFVFLDGEGITYPLKALDPRQFAEIDLRQARDQQVVGETGRTLPSEGAVGQVHLVLHGEPGSAFPKRLLAMGVIEDRGSRSSVTFQGCATCPPVLSRVTIDPSRIEGFVGSTGSFRVLANYSNGGVKIVNVTSSANLVASPSTVVRIDGDQLHFLRSGTASLTASAFDCLEVEATEPGLFGEVDCGCSYWGSLYGQSFVRSKSTLLTVHMKAFIPFNWLGAPSPQAFCFYVLPGPAPIAVGRNLIFKGDDRSYSSSYNASARARLLAFVGVSSLQNRATTTKSIGQSRSYAENALEGDNRIGPSDEDGIAHDCNLWHDAATQSVSSIQVDVNRISERVVEVHFTGSTSLPLLIAPAIDWDLRVRLEISGDKMLWSVNGWEDGFPAFEMYVGGTPIYRRKPSSRDEVYKLFDGLGDVAVSARGEIR